MVGHDGYLPPYISNLLIAKDQDIGVFVTVNKDDFNPSEISSYALALAGEVFRKLHKPELPAVPPEISLPEERMKPCI